MNREFRRILGIFILGTGSWFIGYVMGSAAGDGRFWMLIVGLIMIAISMGLLGELK